MYHPSSSSSSSHSQKSMGSSGGGGGLTRYSSAPGSLLANAVDSVIGNPNSGRGDFSALGSSSSSSVQPPRRRHHHPHPPPPPSFLGHYFSADSSSLTSESTCKVNSSNGDPQHPPKDNKTTGLHDLGVGVGSSSASPRPSSSSLLRQRSSPAGFLSHLTPDTGPCSFLLLTFSYFSRGPMCGSFSGLLRLFWGFLSVFLILVICSVRCCCLGFLKNTTLVMHLVLLFMVSAVDLFIMGSMERPRFSVGHLDLIGTIPVTYWRD